MSGQVIMFPERAARASSVAPAMTPDAQRLATALGGLETALAAQRDAVAAWRTQIERLRGSMASLSASAQRYNAALDTAAARLEP